MSTPLFVAHITFGLDVGGLERMLLQFAQHADPLQTDQLFVSLGHNGPVGEQLRLLGFPVVCLHRPSGFRYDLALAMARMFRNTRPDVVHTHDARALLYGATAAKLAGVGHVVHTQHGQNLGLSQRQRTLVRHSVRLVQHYVCVSRDAARGARELGLPPEKLRTIHNGVDLSDFTPSCPADDTDRSVFAHAHPDAATSPPAVCVARLSPEKGVSDLLKAVSVAIDEAPDFLLDVAGDGPCRAELEQEATRLKLTNSVRFLGRVDDVASRLRSARFFVLPSLSEGIPLTLLEAMATGLPTLATRVGGVPEVIGHGKNGLLVDPSDPAAMARELVSLWNDPLLCGQLGEEGRRTVEQRFDIRDTVAQYEALYAASRTTKVTTRRRPPQAAGS